MTKYILKKDTPAFRAGYIFETDPKDEGVLLDKEGVSAFYANEIENFDEWFDRVEDKQWINDVTRDILTNRVQLEFADGIESIDFQSFICAVKAVSNDAGFMTRGSDRVGWTICLKDDGQLGTTVTSYELAGGFCFEWGSDAEASIKNHPDEWKTIAKYKWGK